MSLKNRFVVFKKNILKNVSIISEILVLRTYRQTFRKTYNFGSEGFCTNTKWPTHEK